MSYKVVRNQQGDVVAFGPDDGSYDPTIKIGETLFLEENEPVINDQSDITKQAAKESARGKLAALGLTDAEVAALLGG